MAQLAANHNQRPEGVPLFIDKGDAGVDPLVEVDAATKSKARDANLPESHTLQSVWSSDGLTTSTPSIFQRPSSTPPLQINGSFTTSLGNRRGPLGWARFGVDETVEENNQEEDGPICFNRQDLHSGLGKHLQRSLSAPPIPDNFDGYYFGKTSPELDSHQLNLADLGGDERPFTTCKQAEWPSSAIHAIEMDSISTVSPASSPSSSERAASGPMQIASLKRFKPNWRQVDINQPRSLVDRVQEDFPRTPSPVLSCSGASAQANDVSLEEFGRLTLEEAHDKRRGQGPRPTAMYSSSYGGHGTFGGTTEEQHLQDYRFLQRSHSQPGHSHNFTPPVTAPPGFQAPTMRGYYGRMATDQNPPWLSYQDHPLPLAAGYPIVPVDFRFTQGFSRPRVPYPPKFGGLYSTVGSTEKTFSVQSSSGYVGSDYRLYGSLHTDQSMRSKSEGIRYGHYLHPVAHSYSSASLLEEFKSTSKTDKWGLDTISGHLVQFARDQSGSRFIQQRLEKADESSRHTAFDEIYPHALVLMADVFGNYVIQKFFDHGTKEQQHALVELMRANMIDLALQVYGCRVIQKALEVTGVDEQLLLIQELRGHVMNCVVDQNGNHVLQKCIEASSWRKNGASAFETTRHVTGDDIQFIVDAFVGHAAVLSTHAYGCRVIQRVLEHCSPEQIRPIVSEIVYKCQDLVKDQFGNYVVQHVIVHGEPEEKNAVKQAIFPEIAKWSLHKYASNVVEVCLDRGSKKEIAHVIDSILQSDNSGAPCSLLPMMKHMYGNYVVQKLLDKAEPRDRQRIVCIILHNADYLKRFPYGKHVLSRIEQDHTARFY